MSDVIAPKYVLNVLKRLEKHGFSAYLVGGCVRDTLMGRRPNDWDICTSALPEEVSAVFPHSRPTGIKHGTITATVNGSPVEITTFRSDGEYKDHRHPDSVRFIADLKGDLERRDFTINALAMPLSGDICDLFGGREDIEKRLIRCVGNPDKRFNEDALRMLRAFRFSSVLGFEIEPLTLAAIERNAHLSRGLAKERVRTEFEKILLSNSPQLISSVIKNGLLSELVTDGSFLPNLARLKMLPQNRTLRWAGLCALLFNNGIISDVRSFLTSLRLDSALIQACSKGCMLVLKEAPENVLSWKILLSKNGLETAGCAAAACEMLFGSGHIKRLRGVIKSTECYSLKQLAVSGDDLLNLGYRGAELGDVLSSLLEHVLEYPESNEKTFLLNMVKQNND
ncbi:MAG: CCA tRNA nucleotidyltransferase [Oscillospiraceae bacterium]|nr:CCA tRNA nucleotidyltransferase [Oscillospiraceae bacterium]